ncbi:hypothetical protein BDV98DRAFT_604987 [Pterulicium gracile]|uniref:Protein kinase domain-containing protein n=1 Tax=Pterulicium gracile TaxID=1884261 RepID=A0A5C3QHN0_9AGAR|nr:hypothetical protein BDV98DRAFT_604987 [Pterula gracilis]
MCPAGTSQVLLGNGQVGVGTADENRPTPLNPPRPYSPPPIPAPDSHEDYDDDGFTENEFTINLRAAQEKMNRNLTTLEDLVDDIRYQMQFNDGRMARVTDRVIGPALCTAVASLHKHHIAHLDIKLDNIVVDETGILMLVDYSIARVIPKENPLIEAAIGTRGLDSSGGGVLLRQSQKEALLPVPSGHLGHWGCAGVEGRGV